MLTAAENLLSKRGKEIPAVSYFCLFVFVVIVHKLYTQHRRRPSRRFLHLSPIEGPNRRAKQRKQKRRHIHRPIEGVCLLFITLFIMDTG